MCSRNVVKILWILNAPALSISAVHKYGGLPYFHQWAELALVEVVPIGKWFQDYLPLWSCPVVPIWIRTQDRLVVVVYDNEVHGRWEDKAAIAIVDQQVLVRSDECFEQWDRHFPCRILRCLGWNCP